MDEPLETLQTLLATALGILDEAGADAAVPLARLLCVFGRMPVEDRDVILAVLEREVELRLLARQRTTPTPIIGLDVTRPNPNARLYVRVAAAEPTTPYVSRAEMMQSTIRAARAMHRTLASTLDNGDWRAATRDALTGLEPAERAAVAWTNREMLALLEEVEQAGAGAAPRPARRSVP